MKLMKFMMCQSQTIIINKVLILTYVYRDPKSYLLYYWIYYILDPLLLILYKVEWE